MARLLLVDDSEAILAFERGVLGGHHTLFVATNGADALARVAEARPDAILLDLTMPVMGGDEVLRRVKADPATSEIPVLIISSEAFREPECRALGADGFLAKPIRADALVAQVGRVLEAAAQRARAARLAILALSVGDRRLAVTLDAVRQVLQQVETRPVPGVPAYLSEVVELRDGPVPVLDLAARLGVAHALPLLERKLVVLSHGAARLALCVDEVSDPDEIPPDHVTPVDRLGGAEGPLQGIVRAFVRRGEETLAVLEAASLVPRALARNLPELIRVTTPETAR